MAAKAGHITGSCFPHLVTRTDLRGVPVPHHHHDYDDDVDDNNNNNDTDTEYQYYTVLECGLQILPQFVRFLRVWL